MSTISSHLQNDSEESEQNKLIQNLIFVKNNIAESARSHQFVGDDITLVAVSKTKPVEAIKTLYDVGHRHFGENYLQEISEKAPLLQPDIHWHFIGHLQSSKASKLIRDVPNLFVVETVDSAKLANKLNNACVTNNRAELSIYAQVHTSDEETKSGVTPEQLPELVQYIKDQCPRLKLRGVMTIGAPGDLSCFDKLVAARETVASLLGVPAGALQLSMGMSGDYEEAVARGATSVRVGSLLFGARLYPASNSTAGVAAATST